MASHPSISKSVEKLLGSAIVALVLGFIGQGLSLYGAVTVPVARWFMVSAWVVAVVGVYVSLQTSLWKRITVVVLVALVLGAALWRADGYLSAKRAELDAAPRHVPPPIVTTAPPPKVPIRKTPRPAPQKQERIKVGSITQGPGSITQIGGTNNSATIYNGPPPVQLRWSVKDQPFVNSTYRKIVTLTSNVYYSPVFVEIDCDAEIKEISPLTVASALDLGFAYGDKKRPVLKMGSPAITPDVPLEISVDSDSPFNVLGVKRIPTAPPPP